MSVDIRYQPDLGDSGWLGILPEWRSSLCLDKHIETDYCIVGAGFAGLAAARRIRQLEENAKIIIIDARHVGAGPAGRNSGFMIDLPHIVSSSSYAGQTESDKRDICLNRNAIEFIGEMVKDFKLADETFRTEGKVNAAAGRSGLRANQNYARHLDKIGESCELLNASHMQALTGSTYYLGGLRTPGTAMIQPAMLIQGYAGGLVAKSGCILFENSAVLAMQKQGDRWQLSTAKGSVTACKTILAVNGFIENFGYYQRRLMHINLYASMTRELNPSETSVLGGRARWGLTPSSPFGSTVRRISDTGGHRILVRNCFSYDPSLKPDNRNLERARQDHRKSFQARFPMLEGIEMEYHWSGHLCLSRNHVWALGEVSQNLYSACCQNGLGATKGTIAGIIAAEAACEQRDNSLVPGYILESLPKKLLPEPFMTTGARSYLKVREWLAGKDK